MRILILSIVVTSFCSIAFAQIQPATSDKRRADDYAKRDLAAERSALEQRDKIGEMLPTWAKRKLNVVFKGFITRLSHDRASIDLSRFVKEEMTLQFSGLSPLQSNILTFYVLTGVIKVIPPHAAKSSLSPQKDTIGEMSESDMLMLQRMMDKKSQLETMISNIMKAGFEGGQSAIQALKAS